MEKENNILRNRPVLMILDDFSKMPSQLPKGYTFAAYQPCYKEPWIQLMVEVELFKSENEARTYFEEMFEINEAIKSTCIFIVNQENEVFGTCSLWEGNHFNKNRLRVHWMAISKSVQSLGFGTALLLKIIDLYQSMDQKDLLYLATTSDRLRAIAMYEKVGFKPYLGKQPANFLLTDENFEINNNHCWAFIHNQLNNIK